MTRQILVIVVLDLLGLASSGVILSTQTESKEERRSTTLIDTTEPYSGVLSADEAGWNIATSNFEDLSEGKSVHGPKGEPRLY